MLFACPQCSARALPVLMPARPGGRGSLRRWFTNASMRVALIRHVIEVSLDDAARGGARVAISPLHKSQSRSMK